MVELVRKKPRQAITHVCAPLDGRERTAQKILITATQQVPVEKMELVMKKTRLRITRVSARLDGKERTAQKNLLMLSTAQKIIPVKMAELARKKLRS